MIERFNPQPSHPEEEKTSEKLPSTVVEIADKDTGIPIRIIYSNHALPNTLEELGDAKALAFELIGDLYGEGNKNTVWGFGELLAAKRQSMDIGAKMTELQRPMFLVDMMMPDGVSKDEEFQNTLHILEGIGISAGSLVAAHTIEKIFDTQLSRRSVLKKSLGFAASGAAITGLAPLARSFIGNPDSKSEEGSLRRSAQRTYDTVMEYAGLDANKITVIFRNKLMAIKLKYVARTLREQNIHAGRHIAFTVGLAHFGIERELAKETNEVEKELIALIQTYKFPPAILKSLSDIPETYYDPVTDTWPVRHHRIESLENLL